MKKLLLSTLLSFVASLPLSAQGLLAAGALPDAPQPHDAGWVGEGTQTGSGQTVVPPVSSSGAQDGAKAGAAAGQAPAPQGTDQLKTEEKQRMLGIMPAFNSVESGSAPPLRKGQKFDLWYHSAIDPFTFGIAGIDAGIEQAENSYPEYHQGLKGFAKRYGAAYADNVDGNFWGNAVLPVVLHQDPRYFRLGHGSAKKRLEYAMLSTVRCKGDNGKWQPSYSNIGGNLIGGAISNAYYPASDRGVGLTLERGFTVTAEGVFGALAFEFYPDAAAYLKRRRDRKAAAVNPPPSASVPITPAPQR